MNNQKTKNNEKKKRERDAEKGPGGIWTERERAH